MSDNELALDVMVFPEYGCVEISDAASYGSVNPPTGNHREGPTSSTEHGVFVYTMTMDAAIDRDQDVRVRVLRGQDPAGLGTLVFDHTITITEPAQLAVNGPLADTAGEDGGIVTLDHAGPLRIQIYVQLPDAAEEVNVLIPAPYS